MKAHIPQQHHMYTHLSNLSTLKSHTVAHTHTLQQQNCLDGTVDACSFYRLLFELKCFDFCQLERKLCDSIIIIIVVGVRECPCPPMNAPIYPNAETMQNKLHKHKYIRFQCFVLFQNLFRFWFYSVSWRKNLKQKRTHIFGKKEHRIVLVALTR